MRLYLVRHAIAVPRSESQPDAERPLTPFGSRRFVRSVKGLQRLGVGFDGLLHSPWLRATQTAALLEPLVEGDSEVSAGLIRRPGRALLATLEGERLALVGHQPYLGQLAGLLLFGKAEDTSELELKKGGVLVLEGEPRPAAMRLVALLPPGMLRRAARSG